MLLLPWELDDSWLKGRSKLTLLVNFWSPTEPRVPHQKESEVAIFSNLASGFFDEIVVLFQHRDEGGCVAFQEYAAQAQAHYFTNASLNTKLRCVSVRQQPTYFDMFRYAAKHLRWGIVVLANSDMVFDHSVELSRNLARNQAKVIATSGFGSKAPTELQLHYMNITQLPVRTVVNRCYDEALQQRTSWDAFVLRTHGIKIIRKSFTDRKTREAYYMNQNGAEAAALAALVLHNTKLSVCQACDDIAMWHFHTTPKTHAMNDTFVDAEYYFPRTC